MAEKPQVLSETLNDFAADPLSDLLGSMHLAGVVLFRAEFREPWWLIAPASTQLAKLLPFRTEHIIPFHIVAEGGCWLEISDLERVWLEAGDVVLLPYGDGHDLFGHKKSDQGVSPGQLLPPPPWSGIQVTRHDGGGGAFTQLICGFLQCDELLFHPILHHLPVLLHVRPGASDGWLASTIQHTVDEVNQTQPGARSMLPRLTELMFVEILRKHMQSQPPDEVGWFAAVSDPVVGAALRHLHAAPMQDWSVRRASAPGWRFTHGTGRTLQAFPRIAAHAIPVALATSDGSPETKDRQYADQDHRRPDRIRIRSIVQSRVQAALRHAAGGLAQQAVSVE